MKFYNERRDFVLVPAVDAATADEREAAWRLSGIRSPIIELAYHNLSNVYELHWHRAPGFFGLVLLRCSVVGPGSHTVETVGVNYSDTDEKYKLVVPQHLRQGHFFQAQVDVEDPRTLFHAMRLGQQIDASLVVSGTSR